MTGTPLPIRALPRGRKDKQELYRASFIISWKSALFFALAILVLMLILYLSG